MERHDETETVLAPNRRAYLGIRPAQYMGVSMKTREDSVVFLLTSTSFPYIVDALDLLFLPSGSTYRFRYRRKWVPDEIWNKPGELREKKAFVVHVHTAGKESEYKIHEFIPLREASINEVRTLGEFAWIRFTLGNWISYHESPNQAAPNEYHELFKRQVPSDSQEFFKNAVFCVRNFSVNSIEDDPSGKTEQVISNWTTIANHLGRVEPHENSVFTKLLSFTDMVLPASDINRALKPAANGYELRSGKTYQIDVLQFFPGQERVEPFYLNVETDIQVISAIQAHSEIRGSYDLLRFVLTCKELDRDVNTFIKFRASQYDTRKYLVSEPFLDLNVKGTKTRWLICLGLFVLGAFSTAAAGLVQGLDPSIKLALTITGVGMSTIGINFLRRGT